MVGYPTLNIYNLIGNIMDKNVKDYNAETIFPWVIVDKIVAILREKNAQILTYSDCKINGSLIPDPYKYLNEYAGFKLNSNSLFSTFFLTLAFLLKKNRVGSFSTISNCILSQNIDSAPQAFFQHDADRQPYKTLEMMQREKELGIVSSNFFFYERNIWDEDKEEYNLDIKELKLLESYGFEIGYHLNAYELANYDLKKAFEILKRDIDFFKKNFKLNGFVPHGGVVSPDGKNNDFIPNSGLLKSLNWYYNGRGIRGLLKDKTWSDGNIFNEIVQNPLKVASSLRGGERLLLLMHPQYYGDKLMDNWEQLPIAKEKWWRELWGL